MRHGSTGLNFGSGPVDRTLPSFEFVKLPASNADCIEPKRTDTRDLAYLNDWDAFFKTAIVLYKLAVSGELQTLEERIRALQSWQHRLLGQVVTQPGDRILQQRLQQQRPHLFGCLHDLAAEPTNNRAERALRPAVIAHKLSCGDKTINGKRTWEILAVLPLLPVKEISTSSTT